MAITSVIAAKTAAVAITDATTEFTTTGPFVLYGDDFGVGESAILYRTGVKGLRPATNKDGVIRVSAYPNFVYVEAAGVYRVIKDLTVLTAAVGYEEQ